MFLIVYLVINENNTPSEPSSSPLIDEVRTNISSSIGPVASTPSSRHSKPVSLTSTDAFFQNIHSPTEQQSNPILSVQFNGNHSDETIVEETYL